MAAEQTFLNAGPLLVKATEGAEGAALAGFTFNVLLIARAPLQLFQAVQTSILPHLTRLGARGETDPFKRSVNVTLAAIAGFAAVVALVMAAIGPWAMDLVFGDEFDYDRLGLVLISLGMGMYLAAATLNQALLARGEARAACVAWVAAATAFVVFLLAVDFDDPVLAWRSATSARRRCSAGCCTRSTGAVSASIGPQPEEARAVAPVRGLRVVLHVGVVGHRLGDPLHQEAGSGKRLGVCAEGTVGLVQRSARPRPTRRVSE